MIIMKKLRISKKHLMKIGFLNEETIRLAIKTASDNFGYHQKNEALAILQKVVTDPHGMVSDVIWGNLARTILRQPEPDKTKWIFRKDPVDFRIFGREGIDDEALRQMSTAMKLPVAVDGALMPDAHVGYGLPIGGVFATWNAVLPYGVGMDIGCRMCLSVFPADPAIIDTDLNRLKKILVNETRFGRAVFQDVGDHELFERNEFREIPFLGSLKSTFVEQMGTSGHGNHFVDIGVFELKEIHPQLDIPAGNYLAVLSHSGSRNFGAEICRHYTRVAAGKLGLKGEAGRLAWLELGWEEGMEYWKAMELAGAYSRANHHFLHDRLAKALALQPLLTIENHHNFAWKEVTPDGNELIIHRKGATPAKTGDVGIIPGTMASPAYIVAGKGNESALSSAAHGAGRLMSRTRAMAGIAQEELLKYLSQKKIELIGGGPDEAPWVYKDIHRVMAAQKDLVEPIALFFPRIVRME